jgi:CubicO group peptidase (beta-lactamase class C family)
MKDQPEVNAVSDSHVDAGGQDAIAVDEAAVVARAKSLERGGGYELPPGDPVSHFGAGFAKVMASNIFLSGFEPAFVAEHLGYFTAPYADRKHVTDYYVDRDRRSVSVHLDNGVTREARIFGDQGAVTLPIGRDSLHFEPQRVPSALPPADGLEWPMGNVAERRPDGVDYDRVREAVDVAFSGESMTTAFVVTYRGQIIGERYSEGVGPDVPLESWSMGKSMTATLLGRLVHEGAYELWQPAPIPQWQGGGDPRAHIRIGDILRMSSGLRFRAMQDPGYDAKLGYPDHLYVYTGGIDAFAFAASRPQQWAPDTVGRYRNGDPVLANYLIRLAVEARGEDYLSFPRRALLDPLGMRNTVLETDPFGNFLLQGYEYASARDWARLANLYLNDGVWNGHRLLPEGWATFVSTLAPAWLADGRPIYGAFFWINGAGQWPIPREAYFMSGAGGQKTFIIPSHDLAVVRIGHYSGMEAGNVSLGKALEKLMTCVPAA